MSTFSRSISKSVVATILSLGAASQVVARDISLWGVSDVNTEYTMVSAPPGAANMGYPRGIANLVPGERIVAMDVEDDTYDTYYLGMSGNLYRRYWTFANPPVEMVEVVGVCPTGVPSNGVGFDVDRSAWWETPNISVTMPTGEAYTFRTGSGDWISRPTTRYADKSLARVRGLAYSLTFSYQFPRPALLGFESERGSLVSVDPVTSEVSDLGQVLLLGGENPTPVDFSLLCGMDFQILYGLQPESNIIFFAFNVPDRPLTSLYAMQLPLGGSWEGPHYAIYLTDFNIGGPVPMRFSAFATIPGVGGFGLLVPAAALTIRRKRRR